MAEGSSARFGAAVGQKRRNTNGGEESAEADGRIPHIRPRPGRRRGSFQHGFRNIPVLFATVLLVCTLCAPASAIAARRPVYEGRFERGDLVEDSQMGQVPEEILFDHRPSPVALYRRQDDHDGLSSTSGGKKASTASAISSPSPTSTDDSSVDGEIQTAPPSTNSPLPIPFDGGLGTNFTESSCSTFMKSMITNKTFTNCLPFSVLLQVSSFPMIRCYLSNQLSRTPCPSSMPHAPSRLLIEPSMRPATWTLHRAQT